MALLSDVEIELQNNEKLLKRLTKKEKEFCIHMISGDFNVAESARMAYPKSSHPAQYGMRVMRRPHILAFLNKIKAQRDKRTGISSDAIWRKINLILEFDPADIFDHGDSDGWWYIRKLKGIPKDIRRLITSIENVTVQVEGGTKDTPAQFEKMVRVKLMSKDHALGLAAKHGLPPQTQSVELGVKALPSDFFDKLCGFDPHRADPIESKFLELEK